MPSTVFLVLMASLGAGFVISAVARTESEAVQYAMIALLVSIFFSGFFISLDRLIEPVRVISYLLPATYGIAALQDIAFLGQAPDPLVVGGAAALALVLLVSAWALMRKRVVAVTKVPTAPEGTSPGPAGGVDEGRESAGRREQLQPTREARRRQKRRAPAGAPSLSMLRCIRLASRRTERRSGGFGRVRWSLPER